MQKHKCECPSKGSRAGAAMWNWMYEEEEKKTLGHAAGKCPGTVDVKRYKRKGKLLWLCSACFLSGDTPVKTKK